MRSVYALREHRRDVTYGSNLFLKNREDFFLRRKRSLVILSREKLETSDKKNTPFEDKTPTFAPYGLPAGSEEGRGGGVVRERGEAHAAHARGERQPLQHAQHARAQPAPPPARLHLHLVAATINHARDASQPY